MEVSLRRLSLLFDAARERDSQVGDGPELRGDESEMEARSEDEEVESEDRRREWRRGGRARFEFIDKAD